MDDDYYITYGNFNPRSPHGERHNEFGFPVAQKVFQSTLPARGATGRTRRTSCRTFYFNPRSPHGERQSEEKRDEWVSEISIHAPRTGSDGIVTSMITWIIPFQSTLPARGATKPGYIVRIERYKFQSTLPARGATQTSRCSFPAEGFQSTLPARGATSGLTALSRNWTFQSTLPARGATRSSRAFFRAV